MSDVGRIAHVTADFPYEEERRGVYVVADPRAYVESVVGSHGAGWRTARDGTFRTPSGSRYYALIPSSGTVPGSYDRNMRERAGMIGVNVDSVVVVDTEDPELGLLSRRFPVGAEVRDDRGVGFRVIAGDDYHALVGRREVPRLGGVYRGYRGSYFVALEDEDGGQIDRGPEELVVTDCRRHV